ncbi:MAG: MBL fold metallo-hydrolase, partial [Clostridiales bacterium]
EEFLPCERHIFEYGMRIGELELDFFRLSHDACQPVGMIIEENGIKLGIITDTGIVTPAMFRKLTNLNALLIEANHNVDMLRKGAYPLFLKKRISGDEGHLSNKQAGEALTQLIGQKTQTIVLAHLSQSNNTPETAYREVMDILNKNGISAGAITVAPRFSPHPLIVL